MKTVVIYHRADFDGLFCREIARKFLGDQAEYIGWDYGDAKIPWPAEAERIYILDLSPDCLGGDTFLPERIIWIDHHKSAIEKWSPAIPGYRIDGVAACRLAWQWFQDLHDVGMTNTAVLPKKEMFVDRVVTEPLAVRLAGEYDVWDKRDPDAEVFQFGLRSTDLTPEHWNAMLHPLPEVAQLVVNLFAAGHTLQRYQQRQDAGVVERAYLARFEGLTFLALNIARCNSLTFAARDVAETGHDALMGYYFDGYQWKVSLYHARHRTDLDLSQIAVKYGGGGHRGACGFTARVIYSEAAQRDHGRLPFIELP